MQDTGNRCGIPYVFVGSPYQHGHGIGSFLSGLFRKILSYLNKGACAVRKEALRTGINVIKENKLLKETVSKVGSRNREVF